MTTFDLATLKPLTIDQYDRAKETALTRVTQRIGIKPSRAAFQRDYGALWGVLDVLALVIFVAALALSSLHILTWAGREAGRVFDEAGVVGWTVDSITFGHIHQLGLIALSESSILLFTIMARLYKNRIRWVLLALALGAVVFVFSANLASGITPFVALLVPAFTVGISIRLEALVVESLKRRREVDEKYRAALVVWEAASHDATKHPDYMPLLKRELWEKLVSLKANKDYLDAPPAFKNAAVSRELARELWAYEGGQDVPAAPAVMYSTNGHSAPAAPESEGGQDTTVPLAMHSNGKGKGH